MRVTYLGGSGSTSLIKLQSGPQPGLQASESLTAAKGSASKMITWLWAGSLSSCHMYLSTGPLSVFMTWQLVSSKTVEAKKKPQCLI